MSSNDLNLDNICADSPDSNNDSNLLKVPEEAELVDKKGVKFYWFVMYMITAALCYYFI